MNDFTGHPAYAPEIPFFSVATGTAFDVVKFAAKNTMNDGIFIQLNKFANFTPKPRHAPPAPIHPRDNNSGHLFLYSGTEQGCRSAYRNARGMDRNSGQH
jgi:hypothetical protein